MSNVAPRYLSVTCNPKPVQHCSRGSSNKGASGCRWKRCVCRGKGTIWGEGSWTFSTGKSSRSWPVSTEGGVAWPGGLHSRVGSTVWWTALFIGFWVRWLARPGGSHGRVGCMLGCVAQPSMLYDCVNCMPGLVARLVRVHRGKGCMAVHERRCLTARCAWLVGVSVTFWNCNFFY